MLTMAALEVSVLNMVFGVKAVARYTKEEEVSTTPQLTLNGLPGEEVRTAKGDIEMTPELSWISSIARTFPLSKIVIFEGATGKRVRVSMADGRKLPLARKVPLSPKILMADGLFMAELTIKALNPFEK